MKPIKPGEMDLVGGMIVPAPGSTAGLMLPAPQPAAFLPCVCCGTNMLVTQPGQTEPAIRLHDPSQPFVCELCWRAATNLAIETIDGEMAAAAASTAEDNEDVDWDHCVQHMDRESMLVETRAGILLHMAEAGYLANSRRA